MVSNNFRLLKEHVDLMRELRFSWEDCEYGGPAVDCKRPFGNSGRTQIVRDINQALGHPDSAVFSEVDDELIEAEAEKIEALYRDMEIALRIVLQHQDFTPGLFVREPYTSKWARVNDATKPAEASEAEQIPHPVAEAEQSPLPAALDALRKLERACQDLGSTALPVWDYNPPDYLKKEWEVLADMLVEVAPALAQDPPGMGRDPQ